VWAGWVHAPTRGAVHAPPRPKLGTLRYLLGRPSGGLRGFLGRWQTLRYLLGRRSGGLRGFLGEGR
jgi:hypothetical protein